MSNACYSKNCVRIKHLPSGHEVFCDNPDYEFELIGDVNDEEI